MKQVVLNVIKNLKPELDNIDDNQDLVGGGLLDSFDLLILVSDLEMATGLSIPGTSLTPENFYSISSIASLLENIKD